MLRGDKHPLFRVAQISFRILYFIKSSGLMGVWTECCILENKYFRVTNIFHPYLVYNISN